MVELNVSGSEIVSSMQDVLDASNLAEEIFEGSTSYHEVPTVSAEDGRQGVHLFVNPEGYQVVMTRNLLVFLDRENNIYEVNPVGLYWLD